MCMVREVYVEKVLYVVYDVYVGIMCMVCVRVCVCVCACVLRCDVM